MSLTITHKNATIKIRPVKDWVIIEPIKNEEEMVGGVLIAPQYKKKFTNKGTVLAVGPGRNINGVIHPMEVKEGDIAFISNWARCEIIPNDDGRTLFLVGSPLIDGIVDNED